MRKVNFKSRLKQHDWTLSQTSVTGPKCREPQTLTNVHQSQSEGPPYLRCWAESLCSGLVLWLFGIYLVIRPLKSNEGMKALALLNLLLLALFRVKRAFVDGCSSTFLSLVLLSWSFEALWTALSARWPSIWSVKGVLAPLQRRAGSGDVCEFLLMYTLCTTHLVFVGVGLLLLNVHGQHLAAEREALSLLNHLLVWRDGVVPHHHMALEKWITASQWCP